MSDARLFFYAHWRKLTITEKASAFFSLASAVLRYLCWSSARSRITGNAVDIFFKSLHFACVSAQIPTDGDDSGGPGFCQRQNGRRSRLSQEVTLSVRWRDKHRRRRKEMKGDKREWWRRESLTGKKKCLPNTYKTRLWLREISCYTVAHKELVEYFKEG